MWLTKYLLLVTGLDGLKGFDLTSFHVIFPALSDGTNMNGTVLIPNPSIMSIEMVRAEHPSLLHFFPLIFFIFTEWYG